MHKLGVRVKLEIYGDNSTVFLEDSFVGDFYTEKFSKCDILTIQYVVAKLMERANRWNERQLGSIQGES